MVATLRAEHIERPTVTNNLPPCGLRKTLYVSAACMRQSRLQATTRAPSKAIVTAHHGAKSSRACRRRSENSLT